MPGKLETGLEEQADLNEDIVQQALLLAERIREDRGGELDDEAIQAVAEATGAPVAYVRAALIRHKPEVKRQGPLQGIKSLFLSLEPDVRRHVATGFFATNIGFLQALKFRIHDTTGALEIVQIVFGAFALWNVALCRDARTAAASGAILGGLGFAVASLFALILGATSYYAESWAIIPVTIGAAFAGVVVNSLFNRNKGKLGVEAPATERQELLRQMLELKKKLEEGEQSVTFLSIDVVGSTKMKEGADRLAVEFTFTEYHRFVEMIAARHGGRVHSTAGDGVICAFDNAQQAFSAAKNIQTGTLELNTFRNKIGTPIRLRAGVHSGTVVAPGSDIKALNFAHVIDIASHLQGACPEGGVAVSQQAYIQLAGGSSAVGTERIAVQNVDAVIWKPRLVAQQIAAGEAPSAHSLGAGVLEAEDRGKAGSYSSPECDRPRRLCFRDRVGQLRAPFEQLGKTLLDASRIPIEAAMPPADEALGVMNGVYDPAKWAALEILRRELAPRWRIVGLKPAVHPVTSKPRWGPTLPFADETRAVVFQDG